jgi:replication initiation and membrane attachment protein DnaB
MITDITNVVFSNEEYPLKIEFVNDVLFHTGEIQSANFFHKIDSWENILSNKICALSRDEAKDVADLIFLSMKYNFTWETMINYARRNYISLPDSFFRWNDKMVEI